MTYFPSNKIKTGLIAKYGKWVFADERETFYEGVYYALPSGLYLTGSPQKPKLSRQIIPVEDVEEETIAVTPTKEILYRDIIEFPGYDEGLIVDYSKLKNINLNDQESLRKNLPYQQYPTPNEKDYEVGAFVRYFCVKRNENIYYELKKEIYDKLNNKERDWDWKHYRPFSLVWTLVGEKQTVYNTNKNSTLLIEKQLKRKQLTRFLKENYLKFYKSNLED